MNVLHVSPYYSPARGFGGPLASMEALVAGLTAAGVKNKVLTSDRAGPEGGHLAGDLINKEGDVRYCRWMAESVPVLRNWYPCADFGKLLNSALLWADVAHLHGLWTYPVAAAARGCRRAGVPYVVSPRGSLMGPARRTRQWKKLPYYWFVERRNLAGAGVIHAASAAERSALDPLGVPVALVPNGVDAPELRECDVRAGAGEKMERHRQGRGAIGFLGRLHPIKGVDMMLEIANRLERVAPGVTVHFAGPREDTASTEAVMRAAASSHGRLAYAGELTGGEKWSFLNKLSLLVVPSLQESFGMAGAEALACGVPVVLTPEVGLSEFVAGCAAARIVPREAGALSGSIVELLENVNGYEAAALDARRLFESQFAMRSVVAAFVNLYQGLKTRAESTARTGSNNEASHPRSPVSG